jgi:hypothetical protein
VLVVDVPERNLAEDTTDVGQLEEHHGAGVLLGRAAHEVHEFEHRLDVLECMTAHDRIGR